MSRLATRFELGIFLPVLSSGKSSKSSQDHRSMFEPRRPWKTAIIDPLHKNSRGDRRLIFPDDLRGERLLWHALSQTLTFEAKAYHSLEVEQF